MGAGKDYDKSENLCFLLNNVMPHFSISVLSMGIINCIRCAKYFSMIVDRLISIIPVVHFSCTKIFGMIFCKFVPKICLGIIKFVLNLRN